MSDSDKDVLCERLMSAVSEMQHLLTSEEGRMAFNVEDHAESSIKHSEFRRLKRSLEQYVEKSPTLLYVGFVGHFSAGKSSTINSLINDTKNERLTDQHPTDKSVTLITHRENSASLVGAHKRGELEVGSSLVDSDLLRKIVVVDTPGSGDPSIVDEMVRDFLPICDQIIYTFSAATPLDNSDLPVLEKIHGQLSFLPLRFIVTRAEEFRLDHSQPLSNENWDQIKSEQFVGDLIARLEEAIPGLRIDQRQILLIDNRSRFNVDGLREFVFRSSQIGSAGTHLHQHKFDYYRRSVAEVRDFFCSHVKKKLLALDSLIDAATRTHEQYQNTVTMAHNRLTESWANQRRSIEGKIEANDRWIDRLGPEALIAGIATDALFDQDPFGAISKAISENARLLSERITQLVFGQLEANSHAHTSKLRDEVRSGLKPECVELVAPVASLIDDEELEPLFQEAPADLIGRIREIPKQCRNRIASRFRDVFSTANKLSDVTSDTRAVKEMSESIIDSVQQLENLVSEFFSSVMVYRSAVLAMNARELAERAGIVRAIDDLEKQVIPERRQREWISETIQQVFPGRETRVNAAVDSVFAISKELREIRNEAERLGDGFENLQLDLREDDVSDLVWTNTESKAVLQRVVNDYNDEMRISFNQLNIFRDEQLSEHRDNLAARKSQLFERQKRRLRQLTVFSVTCGVLIYLGFWFWQRPFPDSVALSVVLGVVSNVIFTWLARSIGKLFDRTEEAIDDASDSHTTNTKQIIDSLLSELQSTGHTRELEEKSAKLVAGVLEKQWRSYMNEAKREVSIGPVMNAFSSLQSIERQIVDCREKYRRTIKEFGQRLADDFSNIEANLQALEAVSAEIREEAITPSFSMFEKRNSELRTQLIAMKEIEI